MRWVLTVGALVLTACGFDPDPYRDVLPDGASSYSYEFVDPGCTTGKHEFFDKGHYCQALMNDSFNGGCALAKRQALHSERC